MCWIQLVVLFKHLYLSGVWFGLVIRTYTKMTCVWKRLDCVQTLMTILWSNVTLLTYYLLQEWDTCFHILSTCTNTILHTIWTTKHNIAIWQIHKLILSHSITRGTLNERIHSPRHPPPPLRTQSPHGYMCAPQAHDTASPNSNLTSLLSPSPPPPRKPHNVPPKTWAYNSLNSRSTKTMTPPP